MTEFGLKTTLVADSEGNELKKIIVADGTKNEIGTIPTYVARLSVLEKHSC